MTTLSERSCAPSTANTPKVERQGATKLLSQLQLPWKISNQQRLEYSFKFSNFVQAMDFANKITSIAEDENHHPDLHIRWGECRMEIWTHTVNGLTENDFILAAKSETVYTQSD